jgi:hypothetical protein
MADSDNVAAELVAQQKLDRAVKLRVRGAHWNEIAERCGYPGPAAALRAVGDAMAAATLRAEETADMMRDTANLRLEHLLGETLSMLDQPAPSVINDNGDEYTPDDRPVKLRAVDEARRLVESLAKLNGVTAPKAEEAGSVPTIRIIGLDPKDII